MACSNVRFLRWMLTFGIFSSFLLLGLSFTTPCALVKKLMTSSHTSPKDLYWVFTSRGIGMLLGAGAIGIGGCDGRCAGIVLGSSLIFVSLITGLLAYAESLVLVILAFLTQGCAMGLVLTVGTGLIIRMWEDHHAACLQLLYFCLNLGSMIIPLITVPDLMAGHDATTNATQEQAWKETKWPTHARFISLYLLHADFIIHPGHIYGLLALVTCGFGIFVWANGCLYHSVKDPDDEPTPQVSCMQMILCFLIAIFSATLLGIADAFGSYISTFMIQYYDAPFKESAMMTFVFWGLVCLMGLIAAPLTKVVNPGYFLLISISVCTLATLLMQFTNLISNDVTLIPWVGTCLFAIGVSTSYGGIFSWAQVYVTSNMHVTALIVFSETCGTILLQTLLSCIFDTLPMTVMYVSMAGIVLCNVTYILMELTLSCRKLTGYREIKTKHPIE